MAKQYVRYVLCDRNHSDAKIDDYGALHAVGILHRTLNDALKIEGDYLERNPQAFFAKVTYERVLKKDTKGKV